MFQRIKTAVALTETIEARCSFHARSSPSKNAASPITNTDVSGTKNRLPKEETPSQF